MTTGDRKYKNVAHKLTLAGMQGPGTIYSIGESSYQVYLDYGKNTDAADGLVRDISTETYGQTMKALDDSPIWGGSAKTMGTLTKVAGHLFTAYDVIGEANSAATRVERLIELSVYLTKVELSARISPSTDHKYLDIPSIEFSSAQEAQNRLNEIFNTLDHIFSSYDLTNDYDFAAAKNFIANTPEFNLNANLDFINKITVPSWRMHSNYRVPSETEGTKGGTYHNTRTMPDNLTPNE